MYLGGSSMHAGVLKTGSAKLYVARGDGRLTKMPEVEYPHENGCADVCSLSLLKVRHIHNSRPWRIPTEVHLAHASIRLGSQSGAFHRRPCPVSSRRSHAPRVSLTPFSTLAHVNVRNSMTSTPPHAPFPHPFELRTHFAP
jgi:hypothetical protein